MELIGEPETPDIDIFSKALFFENFPTIHPEVVTGFLPAKHLCSSQSCHIVSVL
jgi:hypothetical protein